MGAFFIEQANTNKKTKKSQQYIDNFLLNSIKLNSTKLFKPLRVIKETHKL